MFNATLESPGGLIDGPTLMIVATRSRVVDHRLPSSILTARIYLNDIFACWRTLHAGRGLPLYLLRSNDLSDSGCDRPSLLQVVKTVGSALVIMPGTKTTQGPNSRPGQLKPASRKDGWALEEAGGKSGVRRN
jgi:hypothetical protein